MPFIMPQPPSEEDTPVTQPSQVDAGAADYSQDPALLQALDEIPHPEMQPSQPAAPAAAPATAQQSTKESTGVRQSYSGFGPDTGQSSVWAKGYPEFQQNEAALKANADQSMAEFGSAYDHAAKAEDLHADIMAEAERQRADLLNDRMEFIQKSAELDKVMHAEANAEADHHLQAYQQQLAAVRQMTVTSPMATLPAWEAGGVSLAMFAQGFLAAQGINIDVTGQVDRWVQRSIDEQQRRITAARESANDQLNLWNIARETAKDDLDAQQRYRGMVLEAMGVAVDINAARFNAPLARAAAEAAKAKLSVEAVNTARAIRDNYFTQALANRKAYRDEMHMKVQERHMSAMEGIERMKAQADLLRASAAANKDDRKGPLVITDDRNVQRDPKTGKPISGGKKVAELLENAPAETQKAVVSKKSLNDSVQRGLDELRELYTQLDGEAGPGWMRKRTSEAYTLFDATRNRIIGDIMRNFTGLAATDKEAERWLSQLKDDAAWLQIGENRLPKLIDGMSSWARGQFEDSLHLPGVKRYKPEEQGYEEKLDIDPEGTALERARKSNPVAGFVQKTAAEALADKERPIERNPSPFYLKYAGEVPSNSRDKSLEKSTAGASRTPNWAVHLEDLARAALDPEWAKGVTSDDPAKIRDEVETVLSKTAQGFPVYGDKPPTEQRQKYAAKLYDMMQNDPEQLLDLITNDPNRVVERAFRKYQHGGK